MPVSSRVLSLLLLGLCLSPAFAGPKPLFAEHTILDITIEAPLSTLMAERPDEEYLAARLTYTASGDEIVELDLKVRTRGRRWRNSLTV